VILLGRKPQPPWSLIYSTTIPCDLVFSWLLYWGDCCVKLHISMLLLLHIVGSHTITHRFQIWVFKSCYKLINLDIHTEVFSSFLQVVYWEGEAALLANLDCLIVTHCWVFCCIFIANFFQIAKFLRLDWYSIYIHANFQTISKFIL